MRKHIALLCFILITCLSVCVFTGCGGSGEKDADSEKKEAAEEVKYPITLENNKAFKFEITAYDDVWNEYKYKLTNKTKTDYSFTCEKVILGGDTTVDPFIYCDVAAGTGAKDSFSLSSDDTDEYKKGDKMKLVFHYKLVNTDTYDTIKIGKFAGTLVK